MAQKAPKAVSKKSPYGTTEIAHLLRLAFLATGLSPTRMESRERMKRAASEVPEPPPVPAAAATTTIAVTTDDPPRLRTPRRSLTHLGHARHGVAVLLAFRPPPPLQGVLVRSGLHLDKAGQHRIRAALPARGPLPHHRLYAMTGLPGLMRSRHQHPRLGRETCARLPNHLRFLPDGAVQLFILLTEVSPLLLIRPGEIR